MQSSKASGQSHKGIINYSLLARLKFKDHIREHEVFLVSSVLPRSPFIQYPWLLSPLFGAHFSEPQSSESILSKSRFKNPFLGMFWNPLFTDFSFVGILSFQVSHFRNSCPTPGQEREKWEFQKMVLCPFCVEKVKISEFILSEPPIWAFLILFGGWLVARGLTVKLSLAGLLGFWQRMFVGVSLGSSRNMSPGARAEEPSIQSKGTTILWAQTGFILWVHGSDFRRDHCWKRFEQYLCLCQTHIPEIKSEVPVHE